ncbi:hypothetical protein C2E23DRAFT_529365 [Lenzites betulinus]|nr:hypothetical protein C2E23DRAFT_529365 [Lenzites betulinus]
MPTHPVAQHIAPEIHGAVFSQLGQSDRQSCAVVCKNWSDEASRLLRRWPDITSTRSLEHFLQTLGNPEARKSVTGIRLIGHRSERDNRKDTWLKDVIIRLPSLFPNLSSLYVRNWGAKVTADVKNALCELERVTQLELVDCFLPTRDDVEAFLLGGLPNLSYLRLHNVSLGFEEARVYRTKRYLDRAERIKALAIQACCPDTVWFLRWLTARGCLPTRMDLSMISEPAIIQAGLFIATNGKRLEELSFCPAFMVPSTINKSEFAETMNLMHAPKLRTLALGMRNHAHEQNEWVYGLLDSAVAGPLQEISFSMALSPDPRSLGSRFWQGLMERLAEKGRWGLSTVKFFHEGVKDEGMYNRSQTFVEDGRPIFEHYFGGLRKFVRNVEMRNAPVIDLDVPYVKDD